MAANRIDDFGAYIPGARKERWEFMRRLHEKTLSMDVSSSHSFAQMWPKVPHDRLFEQGVTKEGYALYRTLRDIAAHWLKRCQKRRRHDTDFDWGPTNTALLAARDLAIKLVILSGADEDQFRMCREEELARQFDDKSTLWGLSGAAKQWRALALVEKELDPDFQHRPLIGEVFAAPPEQNPRKGTEEDCWRIARKGRGGYSYLVTDRVAQPTLDEAAQAFASMYGGNLAIRRRTGAEVTPEEREQRTAARRRAILDRFRVVRYRYAPGDYFLRVKVAGMQLRASPLFGTGSETRRWKKDHADALVDAFERLGFQPSLHASGKGGRREGPRWRKGSITPDEFLATFGFRGVQFGNYMTAADRRGALDHLADALFDLSDILRVEPRALSLDGDLAVALGARGRGGKNAPVAHYEPTQRVINITKRAGAGSFAHEWFHALDYSMGRRAAGLSGAAPLSATMGRGEPGALPAAQAMHALVGAFDGTHFKRHARALDMKRKAEYWATPVELCARAFERYVHDRLDSERRICDYLVYINLAQEHTLSDVEFFRMDTGYGGNGQEAVPKTPAPYPMDPEECRVFADRFDAVVDACGLVRGRPRVVVEPVARVAPERDTRPLNTSRTPRRSSPQTAHAQTRLPGF